MRSHRFQSKIKAVLYSYCSSDVVPSRTWVETESACFDSGRGVCGIDYACHDNQWFLTVIHEF